MIRFSHYIAGALVAVLYDFERAGDAIREHSHSEELAHNLIVLAGAVSFESGASSVRLEAGSIFDFDGSRPHCIRAIEAGARTAHFLLHPTAELATNLKGLTGTIE